MTKPAAMRRKAKEEAEAEAEARKEREKKEARARAEAKPKLTASKWIGTLEVAAKLGCHPMSIHRFIKDKPDFPQPVKPFSKNLWDEAVIDAYAAKLMGL